MAAYLRSIATAIVMFGVTVSVFGRSPTSAPTIPLGGEGSTLSVPGETRFRLPDDPKGFYKHGFRLENDGTIDYEPLYGVRMDVRLPDQREVEFTVGALIATREGPDQQVSAVLRATGEGWHTLTVPWSAMQFDHAGTAMLKFGKGVSVAARFVDDAGARGEVQLRNVRLIKAPAVSLECDIRGKAAATDGEVQYEVLVGNCTELPQSISLSFSHLGWETMQANVEPSAMKLTPGETQKCVVTVDVGSRVPPGGHEQQVLQAVANGDAVSAQNLTFVTTSQLAHPYILHTPARWQEVKDKVKNYPWAKEAQDAFVERAQRWNVPEVAKPPRNDPNDTYGPFLFATQNENDLLACCYSWILTGNRDHANKAAEFLRRLSNPQDGYPVTLRGCSQSLVQEGHFFQHIAMAYDMLLGADVLSDADRQQIEATLRTFMKTIHRECARSSINNWNLSESCGAFYCALAMQDMVEAERFFAGPGGVKEQLAKGTMDDGWWYECSISYNMWCASEFTQAALAYEPFGVSFRHAWVPASYSPKVLLHSELSGGNGVASPEGGPNLKNKPFGMDPTVYGPTRRSYRTITDLWNSLLPFIDYRGVMFGLNDSAETKVAGNRTEVSGQPFEIAYYAYRDPKYAAMIKLGGGKRDLLYSVPELPEKTPEQFRDSATADNVGLVMLRSQAPNRPIREQIQAALHYGTHGWAHGHFDRTDLLCLFRYGRNFWNPESIWWAYEPFMYKFYVQTSVNHNMVVVDQKMQEAAPGQRLLFHTGKMMQATVLQTTSRWSNPPYGGMVYDYVPVKTFEEKCWREGRFVPVPEKLPPYGTMTGYTEPILQRRAMIVTDDYVVLADYVKGEKSHTFDNLLQLKGLRSLEAPDKKFIRHDAQWNPDPVGSAQFVTDCNWYDVAAPAVAHVETKFGPGTDQAGNREVANEPGVLKLDVHTLWPAQPQVMIATAPEPHDTEKRLFYTVRGDGKTLAEGKFGSWILGKADIDVPVEGVKYLELETRVELSRKPTVLWANPRLVLRNGREIPITELSPAFDFENVLHRNELDKDYFGGPIKIAGESYPFAIAGQPRDEKQPARARVNLEKVDAVRFRATLGSDYPPGPESERRKVFAVRAPDGVEATFLTVIEPYEDKSVVKSAAATGPGQLRVQLIDGREQTIDIGNFVSSGTDIVITISESKDGSALRTESTRSR